MPAFATEVAHNLGKETATERLKHLMEQMRVRYAKEISEMDGAWTDNVLDFKLMTYGIKVDGKLTVEDDVARVDGNLPLVAMMFKGKIVESIRAALENTLTA